MGIPIYAFSRMVPRAEYFQLSEEGRHQAWWKVVGEVGRKEEEAGVQNVVVCRGVVDEPTFLSVKRYPDMDAYIRWTRVWRSKTHLQKYWDFTVELGCADGDMTKAFGETKAEKPTW